MIGLNHGFYLIINPPLGGQGGKNRYRRYRGAKRGRMGGGRHPKGTGWQP